MNLSLNTIPYENVEAEQSYQTINSINSELNILNLSNRVRIKWGAHYAKEPIMQLLLMIRASEESETKHKLFYYINNLNGFKRYVNRKNPEDYGLIINQENPQHFDINDYSNVTFLMGAQEHMKQHSQHFLRIFTINDYRTLFVWTNKELSLENMYKLLALQEKLFPINNKIYNDLLDKWIKKDTEAVNKALNDFFNSDKINDIRYQELLNCFKTTQNNKIKQLQNRIDSVRRDIQAYEGALLSMIDEIRDKTENINFLKSNQDGDEEVKLLFKYLKKSPYIKTYDTYETGIIVLKYHAPLLYFNDYPAEKMLEQGFRSADDKAILKIILGKKYTLWTKCGIEFNFGNLHTSPIALDNDESELLPHPHIARYSCFGSHLTAVREAAEAGNYVGVIDQLTQAVLNLNFYDGCVIDTMLRTLNMRQNNMATWRCEATEEMLTTAQVKERGDYYEEA